MPTKRRVLLITFGFLPIVAMLCLLVGCGYNLGAPYSQEIRTVHVPLFTTDGFRRGVDLQLTEAVQKQITQRTPYRLASGAGADTRLTGKVVSVDKRVQNQTRGDDPRELEVAVAVEITWIDNRTGQVLGERSLSLPNQAAQAIQHTNLAPETGQSWATASQDAVDQLARQIVGMMELPW